MKFQKRQLSIVGDMLGFYLELLDTILFHLLSLIIWKRNGRLSESDILALVEPENDLDDDESQPEELKSILSKKEEIKNLDDLIYYFEQSESFDLSRVEALKKLFKDLVFSGINQKVQQKLVFYLDLIH